MLWDCEVQNIKAEPEEEAGSAGKDSQRGCRTALGALGAF